MDDSRSAPIANDQASYRGLRDWIEKVDGFGELLRVDNASWDAEMGSITQMMTEKSRVMHRPYYSTTFQIMSKDIELYMALFLQSVGWPYR